MYYFAPKDSAVYFLDSHAHTRIDFTGKSPKLKTDRKLQLGKQMNYELWKDSGVKLPAGKKVKEATLEPLALWATRDLGYYQYEAVPGGRVVDPPSGVWASISSPGWAWKLSFGCGEYAHWQRPIHLHGGHPHKLYPHAAGLVLTSLSPKEERVYAAFLDLEGMLTSTFDAVGINVPVYANKRLAWQRDEDTIVLREANGTERSFSIEATTRQALSAKKNPRLVGASGDWLGGLTNAGVGQILLGEQALLFVPWHGETILDLIAQTELHRKLPEAEHPVRLSYVKRMQRAARFAKDADIYFVGNQLEIKNGRFWQGFSSTRGEGGMVGVLVSAAAAAYITEDDSDKEIGGWRSSGSSGGGHNYLDGTADEAELLRAFQIFDAHQTHLSWSLWGIRAVYERRLESNSGSNHYNEVMGPPFTKPAEKLFMQAFLESAEDAPHYGVSKPKSTFSLLSRVETWRKAKLTEESFLTRAKKAQHSNIDEDLFQHLAKAYFHDGPWKKK